MALPFREGAEMSCLQHLRWSRTGHGTDEPALTDQGPAEGVLATSSRCCRPPAASW